MRKERVSGAVELGNADDVVSLANKIGDGDVDRGSAGTDAQCLVALFEHRDPLFQDGGRGIAEAAVDVARNLEIEQRCAMIGAVELVGDALIDRDCDRFCGCRSRNPREWPVFRRASADPGMKTESGNSV